MTSLDLLFLVSGLTLVVALAFGRWRLTGPLLVVLYGAQFAALVHTGTLFGDPVTASFGVTVLDQPMHWRYDALSWFFAMITIGAGFFSAWYAAGAWAGAYAKDGHSPWLFHVALAANVFAMVVLLGSGDFLSLFLGWELVSWASFLLMAIGGPLAGRAALRYLTYAFSGAMAILGAMALLYTAAGSLEYAAVVATIPSLSTVQVSVLIALLGGGFAVKMGLLPFHLWQAAAYAETPGPGSAFLGAISARMGLYAIVVVIVGMVGVARLVSMEIPYTFMSARDLIAWIAALTVILPTYTALQQHDARYLLAWHGIGQGGYMLLGLVVGNAVGSAGGLLHIFTYAITQAALLMAVFAVVHRTGTTDLNKLGGLVTRMPLTFLVLLIGIISLAGLPPMGGFVSKWMVYRSLITEGMPLLFVGAVVGTLGTILSVYKLIHNIFLGQLRLEHERGARGAPVHAGAHAGPVDPDFPDGLHPRAGPRLGGRGAAPGGPAGGAVQPGWGRGPTRRARHDLAGQHPDGRLRCRRPGLLRLRRQVPAGPSARQLCRRPLPDRGRALPVQRQFLRRADAPDRALVPRRLPLAGGVRGGGGGLPLIRHELGLPFHPTPALPARDGRRDAGLGRCLTRGARDGMDRTRP